MSIAAQVLAFHDTSLCNHRIATPSFYEKKKTPPEKTTSPKNDLFFIHILLNAVSLCCTNGFERHLWRILSPKTVAGKRPQGENPGNPAWVQLQKPLVSWVYRFLNIGMTWSSNNSESSNFNIEKPLPRILWQMLHGRCS